MRRLVVSVSLVFAAASWGAALPGRAAGASPPSVPGLASQPLISAGSAVIPAPGPKPTVAQCIQAWNAGLPQVTLRWIGGLHPYAASVSIGKTFSSTKSGTSAPKNVSGPVCNVLVDYGHLRDVQVTGVWKHGRITGWWGTRETNLPLLLSGGNALVDAHGSLRLPSTVPVQVPTTVPGLPDPSNTDDPSFTPAPGPTPTAAQCAAAFNSHAPPVTLQWIATLKPYGAFVYTIKDTSSNSDASTTTSVSGPECDIRVLFGYQQDLEIDGVWKKGGVSAWDDGGFGNLALAESPQNASVTADGSLHLR